MLQFDYWRAQHFALDAWSFFVTKKSYNLVDKFYLRQKGTLDRVKSIFDPINSLKLSKETCHKREKKSKT